MNAGAIIVDLAAETGGNCTLSKPGEIVEHGGVKILAPLSPKTVELSSPEDRAPVRITVTERPNGNGHAKGEDSEDIRPE